MGFKARNPLEGFDLVRMNSIRWTQWLQRACGVYSSHKTEFMRTLSFMTDTWFMYLYIYPICSLIHPVLGFQVIFALITSEWISIILKCIFPDDRPYWWFPTTEYSDRGAHETTIYEFPETCETTSGFPSSHSMLFAACTVVILLHFLERLRLKNIPKSSMRQLETAMIGVWLAFNLAGMLGRIFVTTNFHYQSIAGFMIGCCIGNFSYWNAPKLFSFDTKNALIMLSMVFGSLILFIVAFTLTPWDPFWSVPEALKWCWGTHHALNQMKKTIIYFALRVAGSTAGFVYCNNRAGIWFRMGSTTEQEKFVLGIFYLMEIQFCRLIDRFVPSHPLLYAIITFFLAALHVISIMALLPAMVNKVLVKIKKRFPENTQTGDKSHESFTGSFSKRHLAMKRQLTKYSPTEESQEYSTVTDTAPLIGDEEYSE